MNVEIHPSVAHGATAAPPSKSQTHRALIAAALACGTSFIENVVSSDDVLATVDCLRALGARISLQGTSASVTGFCLQDVPAGVTLPCRESGSTLRFLIPLALTIGKEIHFTGSEHLFHRPLSVYEEICREKGHRFEWKQNRLTLCGRLISGEYTVPGNISSQFISGLCFALPLLTGDSTIRMLPPVESCSYLELTRQTLTQFGVTVSREDHLIHIPGSQHYTHRDILIEGDWSNAAYLDAFGLLGGSVTLSGLNPYSAQGDNVYPRLFQSLQHECAALNLSDCPDLGPILFALASLFHGGHFTGTHRLRLKESDRVSAMAQEMKKLGAVVRPDDDSVTILPTPLHAPSSPLSGHGDHRIVMALTALLSVTGGVIEGAESVRKSFPRYFESLSDLGIKWSIVE